jgi:hypothetical protein
MRVVVLLVLLVLSMGCIFPTTEHVCPDGRVVADDSDCKEYKPEHFNVDPFDYSNVYLNNNQSSYVLAGGEIRTIITINEGEGIWLLDGYLYPDNPKPHPTVEIINVSNGSYLVNFSAPEVPGPFRFSINKRVDSKPEIKINSYNLTVISPVGNETMVYAIADAFMNSKIPDDFGAGLAQIFKKKRNWHIITKEANETGDSWEVFLEAEYDRCDIDHNYRNCIKGNTVTGRFIIDKRTGQIVG